MQVGALVGVDAAHRLAHGAVEGGVGFRIDPLGGDFGAVEERRADQAATLLLRERDMRLGQGGGVELALHQRGEPVARAVGRAAEFYLLAAQKTFEHVQRDVVGAEIERHADGAVGELLRGIDRRIGRDHERRIGDDGAAAELAASRARVLHAAIVAPLAGVIHVRLALLEQLAVAGEGIDAFGARHVRFDLLLHSLLAVGPLDQKPFLLEQPLVIGDELGQPLERRRRFQNELLHGLAPGVGVEQRGRRRRMLLARS